MAKDHADAAARFGGALLDHVDLLSRFPRMGEAVRKRSHVRKLVHSPVVVYYRIQEKQRAVQILQFQHGSRKAPQF